MLALERIESVVLEARSRAEWQAVNGALAYAGGAAAALAEALDPERYLGSADAFTDRALARYREQNL